MPNINKWVIPKNIDKPVETVYEIEKQEIKKSPLSPAARNKVINKSGGNLQSEKEGYGPMPRGGGCGGYLNEGLWGNSIVMSLAFDNRIREREKLEEKISGLESSLSRVEKDLKEVKVQYKHGELSNYRLREIIRQKEERIRDLERENREVSSESAERWRKIGKLEAMIEELKELL